MCFLQLEDKYGSLEIVVFPSVYQAVGGVIKDRAVLFVKGKISCKEDENPKILADMIEPAERFCQLQLKRNLCVRLDSKDECGIKAVKMIARKYFSADTTNRLNIFFEDIRKMTGIKSAPTVTMCSELICELQNYFGDKNVAFMN